MTALRTLLAMLWFSLVFFLALPAAILWARGRDLAPDPGAAGVAGLVALGGLGGLLAGLVAWFVRRGRGTPVPLDPPRHLLAAGPYRYARNPMYLLYVAVAAAEALLFRSPALAAYAAALFGVAHLYVVRAEEPRLLERFGADYAAYRRRVPRWIPRRPR